MIKNIIVVSIIFAMIIGFYFATNANGSENPLNDKKAKIIRRNFERC